MILTEWHRVAKAIAQQEANQQGDAPGAAAATCPPTSTHISLVYMCVYVPRLVSWRVPSRQQQQACTLSQSRLSLARKESGLPIQESSFSFTLYVEQLQEGVVEQEARCCVTEPCEAQRCLKEGGPHARTGRRQPREASESEDQQDSIQGGCSQVTQADQHAAAQSEDGGEANESPQREEKETGEAYRGVV